MSDCDTLSPCEESEDEFGDDDVVFIVVIVAVLLFGLILFCSVWMCVRYKRKNVKADLTEPSTEKPSGMNPWWIKEVEPTSLFGHGTQKPQPPVHPPDRISVQNIKVNADLVEPKAKKLNPWWIKEVEPTSMFGHEPGTQSSRTFHGSIARDDQPRYVAGPGSYQPDRNSIYRSVSEIGSQMYAASERPSSTYSTVIQVGPH